MMNKILNIVLLFFTISSCGPKIELTRKPVLLVSNNINSSTPSIASPTDDALSSGPIIQSSTSYIPVWPEDDTGLISSYNAMACTDESCNTNCTLEVSPALSGITPITEMQDGLSYYICLQAVTAESVTTSWEASLYTVTIDTEAPIILTDPITVPSDQTYLAGEDFIFWVKLNKDASVSGTPRIAINIGGTTKYATYSDTSGNEIKFVYSIESGLTDENGISVDTSVDLNGGNITALNGLAPSDLTIVLPVTTGILVDSVAPTISSVTLPPDQTYALSSNLDFILTLDDSVDVVGSPRLTLDIGGTTKYAYTSDSSTSILTFRYQVEAGLLDLDGISLTNSLDLNGGTIKDNHGNNLSPLTFTAGSTAGILVDSAPPAIQSVTLPSDGSYNQTDDLDFILTMNKTVNVSTDGGTPRLTLNIGGDTKYANYLSMAGMNLTFRYTVESSANVSDDNDGIGLTTTLDLNGGAIYDNVSNDLNPLTFTAGSTAGILVDNTPPSFTGTATVPANNTYGFGSNLDFIIPTTENVTVDTGGGTPTISLNIAGAPKTASYLDTIGSSIRFRYTVELALTDLDGIEASSDVVLNGGIITDTAGNNLTPLTYTLPSLANVWVDSTQPAASGPVTLPTNGWYVKDATLDFIVPITENVTVDIGGGIPYVALNIGGSTKNASYVDADGSGGNVGASLRFRYIVESNLYDSDGIGVTGNIVLNGGTIKDSVSYDMNPTTFTVGSTAAIWVDSVDPSVQSVTLPANGYYKEAQNLDFVTVMNESINVSTDGGTPRLTLDINGLTRYANYLSTAGSSVTFRYTVGNLSDVSPDLNGIGLNGSIDLNGGAIFDTATNDLNPLTFTAGSTAGIMIDNEPPYFTGTATVPATKTYALGEFLDFTLSTNENVTVDTGGGTPTISLNIGGAVKTANYLDADGAGGDIGSSLRFRYTVETGLYDNNGIDASAAIILNSGTIVDIAGNNLTPLTYTLPSLAGVTIDTSSPVISGAITLPSNGWYTQNATMDFILTTSENVTVDTAGGTPYVEFVAGGPVKTAFYVDADGAGGHTGSSLRFRYIVESGLYDNDGIALTTSIILNSGTINDIYGNALSPLSFSAGSTAGILIDSVVPSVQSVTLPSNGYYKEADNLDFVTVMNESINVSTDGGTPRLTLDINGLTKYANYLSTAGANVTFRYTVGNLSDVSPDLNGIGLNGSIDLNGGAIYDNASNDLSPLTFTAGSTTGIMIDNEPPYFTGTATIPATKNYTLGEFLDFTLSTNENVTVDTGGGTPTISLNIGGTAKTASYLDADGAGGDIGSSIRFRYTIEAGLEDFDGIDASAAVVLNSGAIFDIAGNNLTPLTYTLPSLAGVTVDSSAPTIIGAVTLPSNGWYVQNATMDFILTTSENVTVDGAPYIAFDIGGTTKNASYLDADGAGGDTGSSLRFRYTVEASLYDANGIDVTPDIVLNGGTINDSYGNALSSTSFSIGSTAGILVDSIPPYASGNITLPSNQWYVATNNLDFVVHMNENVNVSFDGSYPRIPLTIGATTKYAVYQSVAASDITFRYTIETGLEDGDGITVTSPLQLSASTAITDIASNDMSPLTFTFGSTAGINVDSKPPTDPTTVSPTTDTTSSSTSYTPTWTNGTDITLDYHQMKACTSNNCSTGCLATQTPATSGSTALTNLIYETLYYVCVQAVDSFGNTSNWVSSVKGLWIEPFHHWTWISGSNTVNQLGIYGTMGDASSSNIPGGRSYIVSGYNQSSDEFYLFGGYGYASAGGTNYLNDLWKWDGTNWTWLRGSNSVNQKGTYGTKGDASSSNVPGARGYGTSWTDNSGNFYIFGGNGYDSAGSIGYLNDLWKWDGSNWTWVSGSNTRNQSSVYGPLGDASSSYYPGARVNPVSWMGKDGLFYIFGGWNWAGNAKNDLWRFDGTNWAWVAGSSTDLQPGVYGTKGVAAPTNVPGARGDSATWTDDSGNLYLFGGWGLDSVSLDSYLNDLWKWDGENWTWLAGSDVGAQYATFGTKGVPDSANTPGARAGGLEFKDLNGNLYLFGGDQYLSAGNIGMSGVLWKWDGESWTYVNGNSLKNQNSNHGTINVPLSTNTPGSRQEGARWTDKYGNFYYFGGGGRNSAGTSGYMNDLWKFTNLVDSSITSAGTYFGAVVNGGESSTKTIITQNDSSYDMTGCSAFSLSNATDFDISSDTCGATLSSGSSCNVSVKSIPQSTGFKETILTQSCTIGGEVSAYLTADGVTPLWTWISGNSTADNSGVYGTKGVADSANIPGARYDSISWLENSGNLFLFGGYGFDSVGSLGYLNDFWKYDGSNWTWVGGANTVNSAGVYGTKGVANSANIPGARRESTSWVDNSGNFYLFGGNGYAALVAGNLNDLWKYDGTNWTWLSGNNTVNNNGVYGTKGVANAANIPGSRARSVSWIDNSGNFYIFGGYGRDSAGSTDRLNDLWKYDGTNWTWLSGGNTVLNNGVYGTKGVPNAANVPGSRYSSTSWIDNSGNLYLFGGIGYDSAGAQGYLNDLWKYDGTNWTWISGTDTRNNSGVYGTKGVADSANIPGGRERSISWIDSNQNLYLFGGSGLIRSNDLWIMPLKER